MVTTTKQNSSIGSKIINFFKSVFGSYGSVLIAIIALSIVWSFASPYFLTIANIKNIGVYMSAAGIIAAGITVSMLLGGLDLSQMAIMALSGIVVGVAFKAGVTGPILLVIAIGVGLLSGVINGAIMNYLHLSPIITTLGTSLIFRSIAYIVSQGNMTVVKDDFLVWIGRGKILGIPVTLCFMVVVYIIVGIVLKYTQFGRNVISVGGNAEASYLSGINVKKTRAIAFMVSGSCAGLSTLLFISQGYVAMPNAGSGADLDAIASVIIGGLSVGGGRGSIIGTFLGMLFFSLLANGMSLLSMNSYAQLAVKGSLLIIAVYIDILRRSKK